MQRGRGDRDRDRYGRDLDRASAKVPAAAAVFGSVAASWCGAAASWCGAATRTRRRDRWSAVEVWPDCTTQPPGWARRTVLVETAMAVAESASTASSFGCNNWTGEPTMG